MATQDSYAADLLRRRFIVREDTYGLHTRENGYWRQEKPITSVTLKRHLDGRDCVGVYALKDERCKWGCYDLDGIEGNPAALAEVVPRVVKEADRFGLSLLVEFSGKKGFHVWLFAAEEVPAALMRAVLWGLLAEIGEEQFTGCKFPPEIFPKTDAPPEADRFGHLVKLPWGVRADNGNRVQFVDPVTLRSLSQAEQLALLDSARAYSEDELRALVEENGWAVPIAKTGNAAAAAEPPGEATTTGLLRRSLWRGDLPCFEHVHDRNSGATIQEGYRNEVLFAFTNHHKRKGSSQVTAESDILFLNQTRCRPSETDEKKLLATVASAYKSDTSSACCEIIQTAGLCPVLLHNAPCPVAEKSDEKREKQRDALDVDASRLSISPLYIMKTDPPLYVATVWGRPLQLTHKELTNWKAFLERCIADLEDVPELPYVEVEVNGKKRQKAPGTVWLAIVKEALESKQHLPTPPEDASPKGIVWAEIRSFLTEGVISEEKDGLLRGHVVLSAIAGIDSYLFRGADLQRRFKLQRIDELPFSQVWKVIHDRGGRNTVVTTENGKDVRVWIVPASALHEQTPSEDQEETNLPTAAPAATPSPLISPTPTTRSTTLALG